MPLYTWECVECEATTSVVRDFAGMDIPPTEKEMPGPGMREKPCQHVAGMRRIMSTPGQFVRGDSWRGGKGSWILLFGVIACAPLFQVLLV